MRPPKASFVIPVYNGELFIAETLDSCIRQTEKNIEIIVVNDGSTDTTDIILTYYLSKDNRIKVITLPKNAGRSYARNEGIKAAQSEVIMTLDSDDIALPNRVKDTLKFMRKNPTVDIVYGDWLFVDALLNPVAESSIVKAEPFDFDRAKKEKVNRIGHSTMAFKKSVFNKVQYTNGDYSSHGIEDWKLQIDSHKAGLRFGVLNVPLMIYRWMPKQRDEGKIQELKEAVL